MKRTALALARATAPGVLVAVVVRLFFLAAPVTPDEGGFLIVAKAWSQPGHGLYGPYWVDRPPGLIAVFRVATTLGARLGIDDLIALRIVGVVLTALAVVGVGMAVHRMTDRQETRPARSAALVAGILLSVPLFGALPVNGELVAAPLLAWGFAFSVEMVRSGRAWTALAAGACLGASILVKQNMIDVAVFAAILLLLGMRWLLLPWRLALRLAALVAVGALVLTSGVLGVADALDTEPLGVFNAMYPFRVASAAIVSALPWSTRLARIDRIGTSAVLALAPIFLGVLIVFVWRSRRLRRQPLLRVGAVATLVAALYAALSIALGGSFWIHYLVELSLSVSVAAGIVTAVSRPTGRWLGAVLGVVAVITTIGSLGFATLSPGATIGAQLRRAGGPHDSVVSLLGDPAVVQASGMTSPYRYLWSLPSRTLDPDMSMLRDTLTHGRVPTWVVVRGDTTQAELDAHGVGAILKRDYRVAGHTCGRIIWQQRSRTPLTLADINCRLPLAPWIPTKVRLSIPGF